MASLGGTGGSTGHGEVVTQVERKSSPIDRDTLIKELNTVLMKWLSDEMVYQLYQGQDPDSRSMADRWLQELQNSEQAWTLCWPLLQHQEVAVQNFGALMLHNKISKSWSELPREQYEGLRVELFSAIARSSGGAPRLVLVQLCRCLVAFAFATVPDIWPNTVVSMVHTLREVTRSLQGSDFPSAILQLLTILPEEYERTAQQMVAVRRGALRRELKNGLPTVLSLLEDVLVSAQSNTIKIEAMKCFSSWVEFGLPLPEVQGFVGQLLQGLLDDELFGQACNTLADIAAKEESLKYPTALRNILRQVANLGELCDKKLNSSDKEGAALLCRMIVEVVYGNMNILLDEVGRAESGNEGGGGRGEEGSGMGDQGSEEELRDEAETSQLALDVVEQLLEGIAIAEPPIQKSLVEFYRPTLTTLMEAFPDKAQYPPDEDWEDWSEDDRDEFIKYREELCDLAEGLQRSMHTEYLQHLCSVLTRLLSSPNTSPWQPVEAVLFLLQGVASNVTQISSPLLHSILSQFPRMPSHPTLFKTALNLLGCLAVWFRGHSDLLQAVLPVILNGLTNPRLATSAALAFRDVCGECAELLAPVVMQIIPTCQVGLSDPNLSSQDSMRLVAAVGSILSSMSVNNLLPALDTLITSRVQSIQSLALQEPTETNKPLVERELLILSAFCNHIYPTLKEGEQHPVILLFLQLWPSLTSLISAWATDRDVVETICVCWNRAMRTVQKQYAPLIEGTVELIIKCYAAVHYAMLLDSAAQLVQLFGKEDTCSGLMSALLQQLHTYSLPLFQSALVDYPDTLQSYLRLMSTALTTSPTLLLNNSEVSQNLFEIGLAGVERPEQSTVKCACSFFTSYLSLIESTDTVCSVVSEKGSSLVQYILQAIAGAAPRSYITFYSDVLGSMCVHCSSLLSHWLDDLLSQDGFPTHHVSVTEKNDFKAALLRQSGGQGHNRILKDKVKEFSLMCRGFHGTLYALQT